MAESALGKYYVAILTPSTWYNFFYALPGTEWTKAVNAWKATVPMGALIYNDRTRITTDPKTAVLQLFVSNTSGITRAQLLGILNQTNGVDLVTLMEVFDQTPAGRDRAMEDAALAAQKKALEKQACGILGIKCLLKDAVKVAVIGAVVVGVGLYYYDKQKRGRK